MKLHDNIFVMCEIYDRDGQYVENITDVNVIGIVSGL